MIKYIQTLSTEPLKAATGLKLQAPLISIDRRGIALSFVSKGSPTAAKFRHSLYEAFLATGAVAQPRYVAPSCHVSIFRFKSEVDPVSIRKLVAAIAKLNQSLQPLEWEVLHAELRYGRTWYGGGNVLKGPAKTGTERATV